MLNFNYDSVDGEWSESEWSECSAKCGGGTQTRTRTCNNPAPAFGGVDCHGESTVTQACNTQHCPSKIQLNSIKLSVMSLYQKTRIKLNSIGN